MSQKRVFQLLFRGVPPLFSRDLWKISQEKFALFLWAIVNDFQADIQSTRLLEVSLRFLEYNIHRTLHIMNVNMEKAHFSFMKLATLFKVFLEHLNNVEMSEPVRTYTQLCNASWPDVQTNLFVHFVHEKMFSVYLKVILNIFGAKIALSLSVDGWSKPSDVIQLTALKI